MKKQIALLLAGLLALAMFSGCEKTPETPEDTYDNYQAALTKTQELADSEYALDATFTRKQNGEESALNLSGSKSTVKTGTGVNLLWKDKVTLPDSADAGSSERELHYVDGIAYLHSPDGGYKNRKETGLSEVNALFPGRYEFLDFPRSAVTESDCERSESEYTYTFSLSYDNVKPYINDSFGGLISTITSGILSPQFNEITVTYRQDAKGYIVEQTLIAALTADDGGGEESTLAVTAKLSLKDPGKAIKIDAPNPDDYQPVNENGKLDAPYDLSGLGLGDWMPENDEEFELFDLTKATDPINVTMYLLRGFAVGSIPNNGFNRIIIGPDKEALQQGRAQFQIATGSENPDLLNTTAESFTEKYSGVYEGLEVYIVDRIKIGGENAIAITLKASSFPLGGKMYLVNHNGIQYVFYSYNLIYSVNHPYGDDHKVEDMMVASVRFTD